MRITVRGESNYDICVVKGNDIPWQLRPASIRYIRTIGDKDGNGLRQWVVVHILYNSTGIARIELKEVDLSNFNPSPLGAEPVEFTGVSVGEALRSAFTAIRMGAI